MYKKFFLVRLLFSLPSLLSITTATAQETIDPEASPLEISVGGLYLEHLNPTREESGSGIGAALSAQGKLVAKSEGHWFQVDYGADIQAFDTDEDSDGEDSSFAAYHVDLLSRLYLAPQWSFDAFAGYRSKQERYGTGLSRLRSDLTRADEFTESQVGLGFVYGSDSGNRSISLYVDQRELDYKANNDYADLFDQTKNSARLSVGFRVSEATRVVAEVLAQEDDFDDPLRPNSELLSGLVGFSWGVAGKTSIQALIGAYERKTDGRANANGLSWKLGATYQPSQYLIWTLDSSRQSVVDASELASDSINESWHTNIQYQLRDHWFVGVDATSSQTEFVDLVQTRELDEVSLGVWSKYEWREHSHFELRFNYADLEEPVTNIQFRQSEVSLLWLLSF